MNDENVQKLHMNKVPFSFLSFWSMLIVIRWCLLCVSYKRTFATWKILECRPTRLHLSIFSIIVNVNQISLLGEVTSDYIQLQEYHIDMEDGHHSLSLSTLASIPLSTGTFMWMYACDLCDVLENWQIKRKILCIFDLDWDIGRENSNRVTGKTSRRQDKRQATNGTDRTHTLSPRSPPPFNIKFLFTHQKSLASHMFSSIIRV